MAPLRLLILFIAALVVSGRSSAQTTVYSNAFPGSGSTTTVPGGTPSVTFTNNTGGSSVFGDEGVQLGGSDGGGFVTFTNNQLATWVEGSLFGTNNGFAQTTSLLSGYGSPFSATLSSNPGVVTWTVNIRTSNAASGFGTANDNAAVVLTATNANVRTAGNGYAITYDPSSTGSRGLQLVRYTGGLTGTVTTIITSSVLLGGATRYASVKVTYDPATNTWSLFVRDDGTTAFTDPATGTLTAAGTAVNATYTGTAMTRFGFYSNYHATYGLLSGASNCRYAYFDNFKVTVVDCVLPAITGTALLCAGSTTTLANTTTGGTWTSGATGIATVGASTGIVTGVAGGTANITYATGPSCRAIKVVTVNPMPTAFAVTGGGSYCAGGTGLAVGLGGSTTGVDYQLYNGTTAVGAAVAGTGAALSFGTFTASGTYTVQATNATTGCQRNMTGSAVIVINPLPAAITGTMVLCAASTTTLSDVTTPGTWTSTATGIATVGASTGIVAGVAAGTATISYTLSTGCAATAVVTVNALPVITGNAPVCVGSAITLSTGGGGTWASGTPANATIDAGGVVTGVATGSSVITYALTATGCINTVTVVVNPAVPAITGTKSVCLGLTTTLNDATTGGIWTSETPATATVGAASGVLTGAAVGTTNITYTVSIGCYTSAVATVNPLPLAITGTAEVCAGLTTTLADATLFGTWSSGSTGIATVNAAGVVTGVAAGNATITYTISATGCIMTREVTVNPLPATITGTMAVCVGLTTTLASAPATGTWTSSNTTRATVGASNGVVTGILNGTSVITYTLPTGCLRTATVTVNPLPAAITGTPVVCVASITTLANTTPGGTWVSGNTGIATVGASNGAVLGVVGGTVTISYVLTATGCQSTALVTVNPLPGIITGPVGVCLGTTVTLASTTTGGTWTSSNTGVAPIGASTGIVTGNTLGTATITYTLGTGCLVTRGITVNPLPNAITGPSAVCEAGSTITLFNTTGGGTWTSSNTGIATVGLSTGVVTGVSAGTVTITFTISATGCTSTKLITVNPLPGAIITPLGDTTFCPGGFVALTANTGTGLLYQWYNSAGTISGALTSSLIVTTAESYRVRVTNGFGCISTSIPMLITIGAPPATVTVAGGGPAVTCNGTPITLDANTGMGLSYQWLQDGAAIPGAVGNSYSASVSGDYSVIVSSGAGCSSTSAALTVVVNPTPSATLTLSGPLTFCQNDSVVFHATVDPAYSYQWYSTSAGAIPGATGSNFKATTSDDYWLVITNTFGCTATSVTSTVVVNPLPNVTIVPSGATIFCSGSSVVLNATTGGYTYQWYKGGVAISGATNAAYTASVSGGYRVQVTDAATGCTDRTHTDMVVTAVTTPVIVPLTPASFCWGGSCLLSTSVTGASGTVSYQWYRDGMLLPGATGSTYNAAVAGDYKCDITLAGSCTMTTVSTTVTEHPLPNPVITNTGAALQTAHYYITYQWYKESAMIAGATTWTTPISGNGNYKVAVTDSNGCQSISAVYVLTGWTGGTGGGTTGVTQVDGSNVQIYPNPAQMMVHVATDKEITVTISSVDGRTVMNHITVKDIDISRLAMGIYTIRVYDLDGNTLKIDKLVKE